MRKAGYTDEIRVYSDVSEAPYNPMLTTYYVSGKIERPGMFPFGPLPEIAAKYDLTVCTERAVTAVCAEEKKVKLDDGSVCGYDKLLIATGARAFAPPIKGVPGRNIYMMRTLKDADDLLKTLEEEKIRSAVVWAPPWPVSRWPSFLPGAASPARWRILRPIFSPWRLFPKRRSA